MAADSSSMGLAFFTRINPNLLVPVVIVFLLMRLKSVCNVSLRIISGLKMFTKKMFAPPPSKDSSTSETKPQRELSPGEIIDKAIARLNLTMIEIQDTPSILHLMRSQLFYDTYDSMIYLCLSSLLAYGWSLAYSCYSPQSTSTSSYCWIVIIILVLMLYSVQILLQIIYMTGFTAKETRLGLAMGATAGALSVALFVMHASYVSDSTSEAIAIHLNALVMQLNGSVVLLSTGQLKPIIYIALSALLSLLSMGLVIPAVRFASTFNKIVSGSGTTPHLTFYRKAMMFSDIVLPFLVAILYSSVPDLIFGIHGGNNTGHSGSSSNSSSSGSYLGSIDAVMSCSSSSDDATCLTSDDAGMGMDVAGYSKYPSDHHPYESGLLVAQLVVVLLMVFTRWSNLQAHLQTHLDSLVHLVAAQIIAPNGVSEESIATLQLKVKLCTGYLMAATSQYVAVPLFAAGCALLLHLSSPTGTGVCYGLYSLAGLDPSSLTASIDYMGHRNTTAIAIETASNPYFTDVLVSLAGISMVGPRDYSTAIMASDFFVKLSGIYGLPHAAAVSLCRSLVFIHSLLWGLYYTAAILLWRFHPSMFVTSSSSR